MSTTTSPQAAGIKRAYEPDEPLDSHSHPQDDKNVPDSPKKQLTSSAAATSAFRNVSACNRCRVRKNKCDQNLPACSTCTKARTRCVGFDPITKLEIPRSYVYFLESRLSYFESLLVTNGISFEPPDAFEDGAAPGRRRRPSQSSPSGRTEVASIAAESPGYTRKIDTGRGHDDDDKINEIVSDIGMVSVQGASDRRYLGSTSGISFARVVFNAIKSSTPPLGQDKEGSKQGNQPPKTALSGGSSMRDSYFGLDTKPTIKEATFPDRELGARLVYLYFDHANAQIPILHRVEFMQLFDHVYSIDPAERTPRELYLLNIVFAIGAGTIFGSSDSTGGDMDQDDMPAKRTKLSGQQAQPEEYHASAIVHLNSFLSASNQGEGSYKAGGDLEDLQAVLLLAGFALLRPVAPGLWYIVGVAMRLAVDLGLHYEDGLGLDGPAGESTYIVQQGKVKGEDPHDRGRREWIRDMRRRLWWCTYNFDRLVSTCVGRPFGITDIVVTTEFPSLLDDKYITNTGFKAQSSTREPSYKTIAHHYFRLRLLQSEILQVLQYQQAQQARAHGANLGNDYIHKTIPSPFLVKHKDFRSWRVDVDQRLWEWKESAPQAHETGVGFPRQFLELNYWQVVIMLYRNSLSVPEPLAGEFSPTEEVSTPTSPPAEDKEDQDLVFLKCAEAGQKTLRLYRQLHRRKLVNYTYLATHHLFMAGISFLYALWHSPVVRSRLTIDDFDFTVLAATSVLGDLMEKCPPAKACRDAFERMSKATIQMCMNTPGLKLGQNADVAPSSMMTSNPKYDPMVLDSRISTSYRSHLPNASTRRPPPQFDMDLHELFPEDLDLGARPSRSLARKPSLAMRMQPSQHRYGNQGRPAPDHLQRSQPLHSNMPQRQRSTSNTSRSQAYGNQGQLSPFATNNGDPNSPSNYFGISQNSYNPDFMSNVPGMEFLNNLNSTNNNNTSAPNLVNSPQSSTGPMQFTAGNSPGIGLNFDGVNDLPMSYEEFDYGSGFDFGVGMGLDFNSNEQRGWGTDTHGGFDLDGFFFGGNGT